MNTAQTRVSYKPGRIAVAALYLAFAAEIARTLATTPNRDAWASYLLLYGAFLILFTFVLFRPPRRAVFLHLYFGAQSALILFMLALNPELDFITALFALLAYQAALVFTETARWIWVATFVLLTASALIFYLGPLRGLAVAITPIAVSIVLAAHVAANQALESARAASQTLLDELQSTHQKLKLHSAQGEELAALEERNRLARELHDSVSQTIFSIVLNTRAAQLQLARDPSRARDTLERLQELTQSALAQIRTLITERRLDA